MLGRRDIGFSVLLHAAFVVIAVSWSPNIRPVPTVWKPLPIEIVPISELTRLKPAPPVEKAEEQPKARPQQAEKVVPKPQKAVKAEPVPKVQKNVEPEAEVVKKTEPDKPVDPPKPEPVVTPIDPTPKDRMQVDYIQALLDKTPDKPQAPQQDQEEVEQMTISEMDALKAQFRRCWSVPAGAREGQSLIVRVRMSLSPQGMITQGPEVINRQDLSNPFFRVAAESAVRAIRRCQPYKLPAQKYESWRDIDFSFNPYLMLGG